MKDAITDRLAEVAASFVAKRWGATVPGEIFRQSFAQVLFGPKELYGAWEDGIVTRREVASALAAYAHSESLRAGYPLPLDIPAAEAEGVIRLLDEALRGDVAPTG
jgi:hypothetical protein